MFLNIIFNFFPSSFLDQKEYCYSSWSYRLFKLRILLTYMEFSRYHLLFWFSPRQNPTKSYLFKPFLSNYFEAIHKKTKIVIILKLQTIFNNIIVFSLIT
ncbi:hypothetical protein WKT22_01495 [Candidatus Lokiarchaeum ossiferum]